MIDHSSDDDESNDFGSTDPLPFCNGLAESYVLAVPAPTNLDGGATACCRNYSGLFLLTNIDSSTSSDVCHWRTIERAGPVYDERQNPGSPQPLCQEASGSEGVIKYRLEYTKATGALVLYREFATLAGLGSRLEFDAYIASIDPDTPFDYTQPITLNYSASRSRDSRCRYGLNLTLEPGTLM